MSPTPPKTKSKTGQSVKGQREALIQRRHAAEQKRLLRIAGGAAIAIVVLGLMLLSRNLIAPSRPTDDRPGQFFASQGHCHIGQDCPGPAAQYDNFAYNSDPPTSGPHEEIFPSALVLDQAISKRMLVHLLEHGNVALLYSDKATPDMIQKLKDYATAYDSLPVPDVQAKLETGQAVFVAPYSSMAQPLALVAWTRLDTLTDYDQARTDRFVKQWVGNQQNAQQ